MKVLVSPEFKRKYKKFARNNPKVSNLIDKRISLFIENPKNKTLKLHKLKGKQQQWSISINRSIRLLFQYIKEGIYITDIGSHDQVY